jgi:HNH endonuclease
MKIEKKEKLRIFPTEKVEILRVRSPLGFRFAVTNYGRVIRFKTTPQEGEFVKPGTFTKKYPYPCVYIRRKVILIHRLVAQNFLPKPARDEVFVIHKDRNVTNNYVQNLQWVNKLGHLDHAMKGEAWKNLKGSTANAKLTEDRVRMLRRKIKEGKTRMKILAKQFGISEMQLYRIKSGENWAWVK